ncbi:MAG TPA: hypothetical protein VGM63_14375, partial [Mucilaginibacter sp.]
MKFKSFIKRQLLGVLKFFKFYRTYSLAPRGTIYFNQLGDKKILKLNEHKPIKRIAPLTTDHSVELKFKKQLADIPQPTFVLEAVGWRVWGNQGAVITNEGYLLKDVS